MKRTTVAILAVWYLAALIGILVTHGPEGSSARRPAARVIEAGPEHERPGEAESEAAPDDWMISQRVNGIGVPRSATEAAARQADRLAARTAALDPAWAAAAWQSIGPTNIGGRILDIALDPSAASTLYVASASGGVWKSTDTGSTFTAAWPASFPQPIGAIAMASDGALYAGTGEAGPGGGSITYGGRGIYKST